MLNNDIIFRLHLVRHAETVANEAGIVLGQIDSPLTKLGVKQSIAAHHEYHADADDDDDDDDGAGDGGDGDDGTAGTSTRIVRVDTIDDNGSNGSNDNDNDNDGKYWKVFSSDLERCKTTSRLILFGNDNKNRNGIANNNINANSSNSTNIAVSSNNNKNAANNNNNTTTIIHLEKRLRERAKGAREGQSKHLTYSEALEQLKLKLFQQQQQQQQQQQGKLIRESDLPLPLLETEMEVLDRFQDWLQETLADAVDHYCNSTSNIRNCNDDDCNDDDDVNTTNTTTSPEEQDPSNVYNVLAISHSGTLRIIFEKMIGDQIPSNAEREEVIIGDTNSGRLMIPNTSKSIIEFTRIISTTGTTGTTSTNSVHNNSDETETVRISTRGGGDEICWRPRLLDYANTMHFRKIK